MNHHQITVESVTVTQWNNDKHRKVNGQNDRQGKNKWPMECAVTRMLILRSKHQKTRFVQFEEIGWLMPKGKRGNEETKKTDTFFYNSSLT
jgi:hypothetical protein